MAEYIFDVMSQTSKLDWAFPFQRTGAFPIDRSAVFSSLADAELYALGLDDNKLPRDERGLGGTSYVGQVISVYEAGEEGTAGTASAYIITPARSLMKLAATTASGDVAADIATLQGQISAILADIEALQGAVDKKADAETVNAALELKANSAEVNAALELKANSSDVEAAIAPKADKSYVDEELAKKANTSDVTDALALKADASDMTDALALKANAADVYAKSETYTKSEVETYVNNQIGSAGHLNREIVEALPAVDSAETDTIYMVKKEGGLVEQDHYEEYMVINGAWEKIGDTFVDLSNYVDKDSLSAEVEAIEGAIALKADASALELTNAEVAKKADAETVNAALDLKANAETVNEALDSKADKTQVATDIANAIAPLAVKTEVEDALALKADASVVEQLGQDLTDHKTAAEEALALKSDKTYVDEELAKKADKATTLAGYGIADAYTKGEVDAALLLKASQQDHNALVDVVNGKANATDVYGKTEVDAKFAEKATTLAGYGITDAYTKGETYTRTEISDLIADITGGESAADVLAALNAYQGTNDERVGSAEARIKALEDAGADDNIIEAIKIAGESTALEVSEKTVTLPAATAEKLGLVKLSAEIGVNDAGALEVKSLNANKLVQTQGEWLIMNGGSAAL